MPGIGKSIAAHCSPILLPARRATVDESWQKTARRSRSFHILLVTRTKRTSRRSKSHQSIADLSSDELADLAAALKDMLVRFDNLWQLSFPYVLVLHQAPTDGHAADGFHFHIEIHPPLRTPNLLKYLAGSRNRRRKFLERYVA